MTLHGTPNDIVLSGISLVTRELAPITELFPTLTPSRIVTLSPTQTLLPIIIPCLDISPLVKVPSLSLCSSAFNENLEPIWQLEPIST